MKPEAVGELLPALVKCWLLGLAAAFALSASVGCDRWVRRPSGRSLRARTLTIVPDTRSDVGSRGAGDALASVDTQDEASAAKLAPACLATLVFGTSESLGQHDLEPVATDAKGLAMVWQVPAGSTLLVMVAATGHLVKFHGPARVRPCSPRTPETLLVAEGDVEFAQGEPGRQGRELFVATPALVAVARGPVDLKLKVDGRSGRTTYETGPTPSEGVLVTTLDRDYRLGPKERGVLERFEEPGVLLTRCRVQATSAIRSAALLRGLTVADASSPNPSPTSEASHGGHDPSAPTSVPMSSAQAPAGGTAAPVRRSGADWSPLPAASIEVLQARGLRVARERALDCAFAEAVALGCDVMCTRDGRGDTCDELLATDAGPMPEGCRFGGLGKVRGLVDTFEAQAQSQDLGGNLAIPVRREVQGAGPSPAAGHAPLTARSADR